jgi:hypothetical protein
MKAVQSSHRVIETIEENLSFVPSQEARGVRVKAMSDFSSPFNILYPQK